MKLWKDEDFADEEEDLEHIALLSKFSLRQPSGHCFLQRGLIEGSVSFLVFNVVCWERRIPL